MPDSSSWNEALGLIRTLAVNSQNTVTEIGKLNERMGRMETEFVHLRGAVERLQADVNDLKTERVTPADVKELDERVDHLEAWRQAQELQQSYGKGWLAAVMAVASAAGGVVVLAAGHVIEWLKGP